MEDYLIREIDRIGEMMVEIARRLGILSNTASRINQVKLKDSFADMKLELNLDEIIKMEFPIQYLVEEQNFTDNAIEGFTNLIAHSDFDQNAVRNLLNDAITYLDGRGYYSFLLHSLTTGELPKS